MSTHSVPIVGISKLCTPPSHHGFLGVTHEAKKMIGEHSFQQSSGWNEYDPINSTLTCNTLKLGKRSIQHSGISDEYDPSNSAITHTPLRTNIPTDKVPRWFPFTQHLLHDIYQKAKDMAYPELEVRLGQVDICGTFVTGCTKSHYCAMLNSALLGVMWTSKAGPICTIDLKYVGDVVTRLQVSPPGPTFSVIKRDVQSLVVPPESKAPVMSAKFNLKTETPTRIPVGTPMLVRIKNRYSFVYKDIFQYDFTMVLENKNIASCMCSPVKYEIEIECKSLQLDEMRKSGYQNGTEFLTSLSMKVDDFIKNVVGFQNDELSQNNNNK